MNKSQKISAITKGIKLFLKSSWLSLLFITLIMVLTSQTDQGASLLVHLLDHNAKSLMCFLLLLNGFSIVVSHYPTYLQTWNVSNNRMEAGYEDGVKWYLTKYSWLGFGIITFRFNIAKSYAEKISVSLRRMLGIVLHASIIYILFYAYDKFISPIITGWFWLVFGLFLFIVVYVYRKIEKLIPTLSKEKLAVWMKIGTVFFLSNIAVSVLLAWVSYVHGWSAYSFWLFIVDELLSIMGFMVFRNLRLHYKRSGSQSFPLSLFSTHQNYLLAISMVGWLSLAIIIFANIRVFDVSPLTLILAYLYFIYGLIIIPIKHYFYYRTTTDTINPWKRNFIVIVTPFIFVGFIAYTYFSGSIGNGLHTLAEVDFVQEEVMAEKEFLLNLERHFTEENAPNHQIFIASYGGGLKANYWNLLLLDTLSDYRGENLLQQTIAMSGVSGGSLGQAFFGAMYQLNQTGHYPMQRCMDEIGHQNFLSMDIAYTIGWDFMRELMIGKKHFSSPDRAGLAMIKYMDIIGDQRMNKRGFQAYWKDIYDTRGYYPALISNSTGIQIKRGIACSIVLSDFEKAFPSAVNILDLHPLEGREKTLSYTGAVSCANRFPVLSPTARVRGKGNFLDGGYFDNSAMLSLLDFQRYIHHQRGGIDLAQKKIFIQIINSKTEYLRSLLKNDKDALFFHEDETGELNAILDVVTSIELLPRYIESYFQWDASADYVQIHLPYHLCMGDVESLLGGSLDAASREKITALLDDNNRWLDSVTLVGKTHWEVHEPPLARLIGEQPMNYMKAIIQDGKIFEELQSALVE